MTRFLLIFVLLFSGCSTISGWRDAAALKAGYTSKARAEQAVEKVRLDYAAKQAANDKLVAATQEAFTKGLTDRIAFAADQLYGADLAFLLTPHPDRTHLVMDNKVNEARAVLGPPSVAAMVAQNAEIKKLLDETQTSLAQLQATHDTTLKEAAQVKERAAQAEADLAAAKQAKLDLVAAETAALAAKQADLNAANDKVIASEHARGDDATARHALMTRLSMGAGLLAALCLAGAIWSPVFKTQFGLASVTLGVATVGIWYLTPIVTLSIVGAGVLGVAIWAAKNQHTSTKTTTALVNAVQDIKEKAPEVYDATVKPALTAWTTKYAKVNGATVAVPDKAVTANIDAQLVAGNRV